MSAPHTERARADIEALAKVNGGDVLAAAVQVVANTMDAAEAHTRLHDTAALTLSDTFFRGDRVSLEGGGFVIVREALLEEGLAAMRLVEEAKAIIRGREGVDP